MAPSLRCAEKNLYPSAPANNLRRMEDYAHRQCVYEILNYHW